MRFAQFTFILLLFPIIAFSQSGFIGKPIRFTYVEVAQYDIPKLCTYPQAVSIAKKLGNGWRLPNRAELKKMYEKRDIIKGFEWGEYYMTDELYGQNQIYSIEFADGKEEKSPRFVPFQGNPVGLKVRLIRTIK